MLLNTLRPRQNGRHFPDDISKCIFLNENTWISIKISLKFVPKGPIDKIPALGQIMAWRRSGDKPLFEPMMVSLQTHICVTRPRWVNTYNPCQADLFRKFMKIYLYFLLFLDTKYANLVQILSRGMQWSICQYRISARCQIHFPNTAEPWREQKREKRGRQTGTGREKEKHRDRFY